MITGSMVITIQDCIDMQSKRGMSVLIENGRIIGFISKKGGIIHVK